MSATGILESASNELVKVYGDRIYSIAKHITQNDDAAGDIVVEAFLEVCSDLEEYPEEERAWLRLVTVAVREAFSELRNRGESHWLLDQVADAWEGSSIPELSTVGGGDRSRHRFQRTNGVLEYGLRSLDPMCRTVFVLRDIEQISVGQIAKIVNRSVAAVKVCLLRARLQLREILADYRCVGAAS